MATPRQTFGTAQTCINTTTNLAAAAFTGSPAATYDNTTDAAVPGAPFARATVVMPTFASAPAAGAVIELWGVVKDTAGAGTHDTDAPGSGAPNGARYFGQFVCDDVTTLQRRSTNIDLRGVEKVDFYLKNGTAVQMTNNAGTACTLTVQPYTVG